VPEGDTIHYAARRIRPVLVDTEIESIETPQPRHRPDRWPERLGGRRVRSVDALGKHLFLRFEGDLTIHSHLRMGGWWGVFEHGQRWRRSPRRAWLIIKTDHHAVVQFDGPVLELMTDSRTRFDQRLAALGPDVLAEELDEDKFLRRLREDDQTRGFGDALLDQHNVAGIGNIWKAESCFAARVDPWRPLGKVSNEEALEVVRAAAAGMRRAVAGRGYEPSPAVYEKAGRPCPRCGTIVRSRGQGDDNRTTFWCPGCQT
jgi:endonuclease VIII